MDLDKNNTLQHRFKRNHIIINTRRLSGDFMERLHLYFKLLIYFTDSESTYLKICLLETLSLH